MWEIVAGICTLLGGAAAGITIHKYIEELRAKAKNSQAAHSPYQYQQALPAPIATQTWLWVVGFVLLSLVLLFVLSTLFGLNIIVYP